MTTPIPEAAVEAAYFEDCGHAPTPKVIASEDYEVTFRSYARTMLTAARPLMEAETTALDAVIEYVSHTIRDPKYGHRAEWLAMNLHPDHLRRIAAATIAERTQR